MMTRQEKIEKLIAEGREFMRPSNAEEGNLIENYQSDQELKKPQPSLFKKAKGGKEIKLPKEFKQLKMKDNILEVLYKRKSSRIYADKKMSLLQLSFLLWSQQGVKSIYGEHYATIRTVACGGARHEFECYIAVLNVEGLEEGYYHYLPKHHSLELLEARDSIGDLVSQSLCDQKWSKKSNVVFYYSVIPYRAEWRYGIWAHRTALIDAGHITQNLYLACAATGIGTCAIASLLEKESNQMFEIDGKEEFIFYAATAGMLAQEDEDENDFQKFLSEC